MITVIILSSFFILTTAWCSGGQSAGRYASEQMDSIDDAMERERNHSKDGK